MDENIKKSKQEKKNPVFVEYLFMFMFCVNCSSRSLSMRHVFKVHMSIPQKTVCGTVERRRRRNKRRQWHLSSPAWWGASTSLDQTSLPARLRTHPTARVRQRVELFFCVFSFRSYEKALFTHKQIWLSCMLKLSDTTVCNDSDPYWTNCELHTS